MGDVLLIPEEAAQVMRSRPQTLARWRSEGKGPAFVKYGRGRVFYRRADIEEWWARQVRTSTSDATPAQAQD